MKFFDFFAGIGGFRLGMEMAGHECVGHCEIDEHADRSYRAMHHPKESEVFFDDIRTIEPGDMPEADCYCFGFPCQSFSIAGRRRGFEDTRGTLFFEVMRLAAVRKPKFLFAENVKGLLNHDGGDTFETIIRSMDELGYLVEWQMLNSKDFGVPQNRERVFIIGHLGGEPGCQILPIAENGGSIVGAEGHQVFTANTLAARDRESVGTYPLSNGGVLNVNGYHKKENTIKQVGQLYGTEREPNPGVILDTGEVRVRKLTPRECFRLQGFPDEYFDRAASVSSDSQLYKQAGNAVTVNVIYEIAKRLSGAGSDPKSTP